MTEINYIKENIRFIRQYASLSQADFAALLKVTTPQLWTFEKRGTPPKRVVLERLSKISGISIDKLESEIITTQMLDDCKKKNYETKEDADIANLILQDSGESISLSQIAQELNILAELIKKIDSKNNYVKILEKKSKFRDDNIQN